jgi:hypothetical protein
LTRWPLDTYEVATRGQIPGFSESAEKSAGKVRFAPSEAVVHLRRPPVAKDGTLYVDAMLLKDANLEEAVCQGADEIWLIWTVEEKSEWRGGFWNHFGHIFEICAVGNLYRELDDIERVNVKVAAGTAKPGQRHVTVYVIKPQMRIPVEYLYFRNKAQMAPVIESGREFARKYLKDQGNLVKDLPGVGVQGLPGDRQ